jgi:TolB-like protein
LIVAVLLLAAAITGAWYRYGYIAAALVPIRTLAVLPLKSLAAGDNYVGFGIADAVIRKTSESADLIVRPTSAVRRYVDQDVDALTATRQLNTEAVLQGTVQRADDRLRVSVNLLRAAHGASLWAQPNARRCAGWSPPVCGIWPPCEPTVRRWQHRLNPAWRFAGGCNLDRPIDVLHTSAAFRDDRLHMEGPIAAHVPVRRLCTGSVSANSSRSSLQQSRVDHVLGHLHGHDACCIRVSGIQQHVECLGHEDRGNPQHCRRRLGEPGVANSAGLLDVLRPALRQVVGWNAIDAQVVWRFNLQQPILGGEVSDLDLEVDQDLEQRCGGILGTVHNAPAPRVPASGRPQGTFSGEGEVIADPPENHLRGHALIDSVQELFNKVGTSLSGHELEGAARLELAFWRPEPAPGAFGVSEHVFS